MQKITEEKRKQIIEETTKIISQGRMEAHSMLNEITATSKGPKDLSDRIFTTQIMACHILANCALNQELQNNINGDEWLDQIMKQIKLDLAEMRMNHKKGKSVKHEIGKKNP